MDIKIEISAAEAAQKSLVVEPWAEEFDLQKLGKVILDIRLEDHYDIEIELSGPLMIVSLPQGSNFEARLPGTEKPNGNSNRMHYTEFNCRCKLCLPHVKDGTAI